MAANVDKLSMDTVGSTDDWTLEAGATKPDAVNSNDGSTGYIWSTAIVTANTQRFNVKDSRNLKEEDEIESIEVITVVQRHAAGKTNYQVNVYDGGGVKLSGAEHSPAASWSQFTDTFTTQPLGGAWTKDVVDAMIVELENLDVDGTECTYMIVFVNYDPNPQENSLALCGAGY